MEEDKEPIQFVGNLLNHHYYVPEGNMLEYNKSIQNYSGIGKFYWVVRTVRDYAILI